MSGFFICALALVELFNPANSPGYNAKLARGYEARLMTCMEIVDEAAKADVPISLAVSVGYEESKFSDGAKSSAGALGAMQVLPQFHCPNKRRKGCNLTRAGVGALKKYLKKYKGDWYEASCHYNGGNHCGKQARRYGRRVERRAKRLDTMMGGVRTFFFSVYEDSGCGEDERESSVVLGDTETWYSLYVQDACARCPKCCVKVKEEKPRTRKRIVQPPPPSDGCSKYLAGTPLWNDCKASRGE